MEAAQRKVEEAVNKMLSEVDQASLRKIQGESFRCSAVCCDEAKYTMEDRQRCIEKCMDPVANAQQVLATELNHFQNRLERCVMDCEDQRRDKAGNDPKKASQFQSGFESCVSLCADNHIKLLPNISQKVLSQLKK